MIDELVNDYCILGDDGAIIFSSYDHLLEFVEKIRAEDALRKLVDIDHSLGLFVDQPKREREKISG